MKPRQPTAHDLECPACGEEAVEVRQIGKFVNALIMVCLTCGKTHDFEGPTVL